MEELVSALINRLDRPEEMTGPRVDALYRARGIEVSERQVRRDIADARLIARRRMASPAPLPHWSEDISHLAMMETIAGVLRIDDEPTLPQLRQAVEREHGRSVTDAELVKIGRRVYEILFIAPKVADAKKALEEAGPGWRTHQAKNYVDPLTYRNPFGIDPDAVRRLALKGTIRMMSDQRTHGKISKADARPFATGLRMLYNLADDLDTLGPAPDAAGGGGVIISRTDTIHYDD